MDITINLVLMTQTGLVSVGNTMPAVIADDMCASQSFSIWFVVDVVDYHMSSNFLTIIYRNLPMSSFAQLILQ